MKHWLLLSLAMFSLGAAAHAQAPSDVPRSDGTIFGTVLAAEHGVPLSGAHVALTPIDEERSRHTGTKSYITSRNGEYRFTGVLPANYRLLIKRIGYHPATIDVDFGGESTLILSAALEVQPAQLEPIRVVGIAGDLYTREAVFSSEHGTERADFERWRQQRFLEPDVRALRHVDVLEAITLGTPDPLRTMQRLPGVDTRDDWTAELWTRGASWDHTRIYYDGVPLFNPVHAGGVMSAINADALGALVFHPGVRSVSMGEGAAGVLNLSSRPAAGTGDLRGYGNFAMLAGGLTLERRFAEQRLGLLVSGRHANFFNVSAGDFIAGTRSNPGPTQFDFPEEYFDLSGRMDVDLLRSRSMTISGLWERDLIPNGVVRPRSEGGFGSGENDLRWGNGVARVTVAWPLAGMRSSHTIAVSRYSLAARQNTPLSPLAAFDEVPTQRETDAGIVHASLSGSLDGIGDDRGTGEWRVGYQITHQRSSYDGAAPSPYPVQTFLTPVRFDDQLTLGTIWIERRWRPQANLEAQVGVRIDGSAAITNALPLRVGPQASLRYAAGEDLSATVAVGQRYQYLQALSPAGLRVGPALAVSYLWLLAGPETPAIRTRLLTVGAEHWLSDRWLAAASIYVRHSSGVATHDPRPGPTSEKVIVDGEEHLFDRGYRAFGTTMARGLEFSLRRLVGRWTMAAGYTFGVSTMDVNGLRFPAPSDRRHSLDVTTAWRVPRKFLGGSFVFANALNVATGAPYTRVHPGNYDCDREAVVCREIVPTLVEEPNAERAPWYASLDALFDWTRKFSAWQLAIYVQMRNVTDRSNAVAYSATWQGPCQRDTPDAPFCDRDSDRFESGLPRGTTLGIRIAF